MIKEVLKNRINPLVADSCRDYHPAFLIEKKDAIDFAVERYGVKTIAELGCTWGIDCAYGDYAARKYGLTDVAFVDTYWPQSSIDVCLRLPAARIIDGWLGQPETAAQVGKVDAVILFWVLLHQVNPNWDEVLRMYAKQTDVFIISNPQWQDEKTVRLFDLGEEEYFKNVPGDKLHNHLYEGLFAALAGDEEAKKKLHNSTEHHCFWQWGITDNDIIALMKSLGFKLTYYMNTGAHGGLPKFDDCCFVFKKV
jgi:hypothetical protein